MLVSGCFGGNQAPASSFFVLRCGTCVLLLGACPNTDLEAVFLSLLNDTFAIHERLCSWSRCRPAAEPERTVAGGAYTTAERVAWSCSYPIARPPFAQIPADPSLQRFGRRPNNYPDEYSTWNYLGHNNQVTENHVEKAGNAPRQQGMRTTKFKPGFQRRRHQCVSMLVSILIGRRSRSRRTRRTRSSKNVKRLASGQWTGFCFCALLGLRWPAAYRRSRTESMSCCRALAAR